MLSVVKCIYCYAKRTRNFQRKSKNVDINTSSLPFILYALSLEEIISYKRPGPNEYLGLFNCPVKTRQLIEQKENKDFWDQFREKF